MWFRAIGFGVIAVLVTASCVSEDKPPVHLKIDYQLRCVPGHNCFSGNTEDGEVHIVNGIDGIDGLTLDCETGSDATKFGFFAAYMVEETGYEIELKGTGTQCELKIREGNSDYTKECEISEGGKANCNGASITAEYPCQVAVERDGDTVTGTLCCRSIPSGFGADRPQDGDLSVVQSNTYDQAATFEMEHCR